MHKHGDGAAAKLFGITQPRMSDLVRGKISLFSLEALLDMAAVTPRSLSLGRKNC